MQELEVKMEMKCPCKKKGKKYELIICKDCIEGLESFGYKLKEIKP